MTRITPVLLSGGSGSRLWPVSRSLFPKQLLQITSQRTMLQETVMRFAGVPGFNAPIVICNDEHRFIIASQLDAVDVAAMRIVLEPVGRNTAGAAAVAALLANDHDPDSLILIAPSDHVIDDSCEFHRAVALATEAAANGWLVTFGIQPEHPETGYGYIERGDALPDTPGAFAVTQFIEKPQREIAQKLIAGGNCLWNSGMFLFSPTDWLEQLSKHAPEVLTHASRALRNAVSDLDFLRLNRTDFSTVPSLSIDYAVMEHTNRAAVVPASIGWSDIGSWSSIWSRHEKDNAGNVLIGDVVAEDSNGNYIRSEKRLVAAVGVQDLVIVETGDAVLVSHRSRDQDVKRIVERLTQNSRVEASQHSRVHRPWGYFESLHIAPGTQVKLIEVHPGAALSLQYHHHRAEHWVVVSGHASIIRGDDEVVLKENESTFIPIGMKHRLENRHDQPLRIIEVQVGDYLGEDDIVRLEDRYKRGSQ